MAIDKGNIKTSANYDVKAQKPLDARAVRPTKADLINRDSWSADGSTVYAYEGMQVYVQDEKKTYYLKDLSKMFASDFSGWELMGTGATPEIDLSGYATQDDLAHKQDILMNGINIKTINGQNVLGRGNIEIEGGSGGITEEKEVYIGTDTPPKGTKVWIDPTGTPSQPSQPSAGVEVIDNLESDSTTAALSARQGGILKGMIGATERGITIFRMPIGIASSSAENPYMLTSEEVGALQAALADPLALYMENIGNTMVMLSHYYNGDFHTFSGDSYAVGETGIALRLAVAIAIIQASDTEWAGFRFTRYETFLDN